MAAAIFSMQNLCVALCLVLSLGHAASVIKPDLQQEHCSWGSQYWCSSPETANLCGKTDWCAQNDWPHEVIQDSSCTAIQTIIKNTRSLILNAALKPASEYDFAMFLARSCAFFKDDKERRQCKDLISSKDVLPKLVQLVDSKLSVKAVATAVGVCKKNIPTVQPCLRCPEMVSSVQKLISKFLTQDAYMKLIEPQCVKLGQGHQLCQAIGQAKYADFFDALINAPTTSVCNDMSQCLGVSSGLQSLQASTECEACQIVVKEIRQLDQSPSVQTVLQNLIKSVCAKLGTFAQVCDILADEGLEHLSELIATEMEPDVICEELKLCGQPEQKAVQSSLAVGADITCEACEFIVEQIDHALGSNITQEKLEKVLTNDFCNRLPAPINSECGGMVTKYSPQLIHVVVNDLNPKAICTILNLCKNATNVLQFKPRSKVSKEASNNTCSLCKYMVTFLVTYLDKNATEPEIEALLDRVCELLPQTYTQECEALVKQYGPLIVQLLKAELQPEKVCIAIGLCPPQKLAFSQVRIQPKQPNDVNCELCKYVVMYLETFLNKNSTEPEIEALLDRVCELLPQNYTQECEALVKQYGPLIIQLLKAELQPEKVCIAIGLCPPQKLAFSQVRTQPKQPNDVNCELCKYVVTYLETFLNKNSTEPEIEALLDRVCELLPQNYTQECEALVKQYGPLIVQLLKAELEPDKVCKAIGLCPPQKLAFSQVRSQPKQPNDVNCELCKYVVTYLETFLNKNSTEAEVEALLDKLCEILPQTIRQECVTLVKQYGPLIVQLLMAELPPEKVCVEIGLCTQQKLAFSQVKIHPKQPNDEVCDVCKYVVTYLDTWLNENSTETEIEAVIKKVCEILPANWSKQCDYMVQSYGPLIIQLLIGELQPAHVCQLIKFCPASKQGALPHVVAPVLKMVSDEVPVGKQKTELCALCESVTSTLENILKENATQAEIISALDKVCDLLAEKDKALCVQMLPLYTGYVIDLINQELPPNLVCTVIKVCVDDEVKESKSQKPSGSFKKGELCPLCLIVFEEVYSIIEQNFTKASIVEALDKVCDILPSTIKTECLSFVSLYLPYVVDLIVQELPPNQICQELGLCNASMGHAVKMEQNLKMNKVKDVKAGELCTLCIYVFEVADKLLTESSTEVKIEDVLDQVCNYLPNFKDQCESFVALYTPFAIDYLAKKVTPAQICNEFALCTNGTVGKLHVPTNLKKLSAGPQCALCEYVVQYLDSILGQNATEQEIEQALEQVCNSVPSSIKSECDALIKNYTPQLLELLKKLTPDQVCSALKLCSSQVKAKLHIPTNLRKLSAGPECVLCEYVMKYLASLLGQNATEQEIEAALDQVCGVLPSSLTTECESFIKEYTPLLLIYLKTLAPDQICSTLGLCSSQVKESTTTTTPAPYVQYCSACKFALYDIQTALRYPFWKQQTKAILISMCSYLKTGQALCQHLVEDNYLYILDILDGFNFPMEFCQKIDFCEPPSEVSQEKTPPKSLLFSSESTTTTTPAPYKEYCSACKFALYDIQTAVRDPFWKQQSKAILISMCSYLKTDQALCQHLVEDNYLYILDILDGFNFPMEFCQKIDFCEPPAQVETETRCSSCKAVVKILKSRAHQVTSIEEIISLPESTCKMASSNEAFMCKTVMKQRLPQLLQLMTKYADPSSVCEAASLCKSPSVEMLYKVLRP